MQLYNVPRMLSLRALNLCPNQHGLALYLSRSSCRVYSPLQEFDIRTFSCLYAVIDKQFIDRHSARDVYFHYLSVSSWSDTTFLADCINGHAYATVLYKVQHQSFEYQFLYSNYNHFSFSFTRKLQLNVTVCLISAMRMCSIATKSVSEAVVDWFWGT